MTATTAARRKAARPASNTDVPLKQRNVKFDWSETPIDWIPNEPYASYFVNEINLILPAGEFWFVGCTTRLCPW